MQRVTICGVNTSDLKVLTGEEKKRLLKLAKEGDADAQRIVDTWIRYVSEGITDIINIFQPKLLLIGGAISHEGDALLVPLRRMVEADMYKSRVPQTEICTAMLGNDAGLIGAAFLGKNE